MSNFDPWILTHSGIEFHLNDPKPGLVQLGDIAHNLARIRRFNGATSANCSVALHSVIISHLVPQRYKVGAFLHDAAEAYIGDIIGPVKWMLGEPIKRIENKILEVIFDRFNVSPVYMSSSTIKHADLSCLRYERDNFMPSCDRGWEILVGTEYPKVPTRIARYYAMSCPDTHEDLFLDRAVELELL